MARRHKDGGRHKSSLTPFAISWAGGGIFFFWQLGAVQYLRDKYDLTKVPMAGASAGALICALAACNVDPVKAVQLAHKLSLDNGVFERPLGLLGVWGSLIRSWLDDLLPEDAADLCRGRVEIVHAVLPSFHLKAVSDFYDKNDLIDACMASAHVPFFLDMKPATKYRGRLCLDGSIHDFITSSNSALLVKDGTTLLFDYFNDDQLTFERMDFLKLRSYDEVMGLMEKGYSYAERLHKQGVLDQYDVTDI